MNEFNHSDLLDEGPAELPESTVLGEIVTIVLTDGTDPVAFTGVVYRGFGGTIGLTLPTGQRIQSATSTTADVDPTFLGDKIVLNSPVDATTIDVVVAFEPIPDLRMDRLAVIDFDTPVSNTEVELGPAYHLTDGTVDHIVILLTEDSGTNSGDGVTPVYIHSKQFEISSEIRIDTFGSGYVKIDIEDAAIGKFTVGDSGKHVRIHQIKVYGLR